MQERYTGPRHVPSALGEGATNAIVYGGIAGGATKLAIDRGFVAAVGDSGFGKAVANNGMVQSAVGHVQHAAGRVANMESVQNAAGRVGNMHMPNGQTLASMPKGSGRTALIVGGSVAAITATVGLVNGWNRASDAKRSWMERVDTQRTSAAMLR